MIFRSLENSKFFAEGIAKTISLKNLYLKNNNEGYYPNIEPF